MSPALTLGREGSCSHPQRGAWQSFFISSNKECFISREMSNLLKSSERMERNRGEMGKKGGGRGGKWGKNGGGMGKMGKK